MLMNSHQVPVQIQAVPNTSPSAAARQGVATDTRQASKPMLSSCNHQVSV